MHIKRSYHVRLLSVKTAKKISGYWQGSKMAAILTSATRWRCSNINDTLPRRLTLTLDSLPGPE